MHPYKNPLKKNLLILSGGIEAIEGIKVAKKMGLRTIVCDGNKNAPGKSYADEFLIGNIYDPAEIKNVVSKYTKKKSIDGVITIASDAVRSVSTVAKQLSLPGNSVKTSILSTDKLKMKKVFQKYSLPIPNYVGISNRNELHKQIEHFSDAVLKPVDNRGSRGVIRINKNSDGDKAFDWVFDCRGLGAQSDLPLRAWYSPGAPDAPPVRDTPRSCPRSRRRLPEPASARGGPRAMRVGPPSSKSAVGRTRGQRWKETRHPTEERPRRGHDPPEPGSRRPHLNQGRRGAPKSRTRPRAMGRTHPCHSSSPHPGQRPPGVQALPPYRWRARVTGAACAPRRG